MVALGPRRSMTTRWSGRMLEEMREPAYEMSSEELVDNPHLLGKALRSVAQGQVVRLVNHDGHYVAGIVRDGYIQELEETIDVLSDSEGVQALTEAREAVARGDVIRGADAIRALLDERHD
jgi:hypothetical protein